MFKNSNSAATPIETIASGKAHAAINRSEVKSVVHFDNQNKRSKQIHSADHHGITPHTHIGYLHGESSPKEKPVHLSAGE